MDKTDKTDGEGTVSENNWAAEMMKAKQIEFQKLGWHIFAKQMADFCNTTTFEIYGRPAMEIFSANLVRQAIDRLKPTNQI